MGEPAGDSESANLRRLLAQELTRARNRASIGQTRLAEAAGYPVRTVVAAEAGSVDVDRGFWIAVDDALDTDGGLRTLFDQIRQAGTISGVLTDLASIKGQLPVGADRIEGVACLLDQLSHELAEAARALRPG